YMPIPPAPTEPHTLSLHDALPISWRVSGDGEVDLDGDLHVHLTDRDLGGDRRRAGTGVADWRPARSRHVADPDDLAEPHTRRRRHGLGPGPRVGDGLRPRLGLRRLRVGQSKADRDVRRPTFLDDRVKGL